MNIAIITPTLQYGGAERMVEFHAKELIQRGHNVVVYCISGGGEIAGLLHKERIKVVNLQCLKLFYDKYAKEKKVICSYKDYDNYSTVRRRQPNLDRIIRLVNEICASLRLYIIFFKNKPDVVHLYQNFTKMSIVASKICGVKKIIYTETTLIGDWFSSIQLIIIKFFYKFCDKIIALSISMKQHMLKLKLADDSKICVIPSMFSLSDSNSYRNERYDNLYTRIGIVGKLSLEKGYIYFLEAAKLIAERYDAVKFIIAGEGPLKEELKDLSRGLGIEKKVEFLGRFNDIGDVMKQIDIFVLSSLSEGMPVTIIEAMAYGKPVVATDIGGINELVKDGETGFVVPARDSKAIAEAIGKLMDSPQKREDFAVEAVKRFKDEYSSEKVVRQIELLYHNELG